MNEKIQQRALRFAIRLTRFIIKIEKKGSVRILFDQLLRSGTSVGANLEEADSAVSKRDFINKISIAKKEARETMYWIVIFREAGIIHNESNKTELMWLAKEIDEIIKILGAIYSKAKSSASYK